MEKILCLDISSVSTGYAFFRNGKFLKSKCGKIEINKNLSLGLRLNRFEERFCELLGQLKPDIVVIEDIYLKNAITFKVLAYFHGIAYYHIFNNAGREPYFLGATKLRNILGVKGKQGAFDYVNNLYNLNYNFKEHNDITDAIALGLAYIRMLKDGKGIETGAKKKKKKADKKAVRVKRKSKKIKTKKVRP